MYDSFEYILNLTMSGIKLSRSIKLLCYVFCSETINDKAYMRNNSSFTLSSS